MTTIPISKLWWWQHKYETLNLTRRQHTQETTFGAMLTISISNHSRHGFWNWERNSEREKEGMRWIFSTYMRNGTDGYKNLLYLFVVIRVHLIQCQNGLNSENLFYLTHTHTNTCIHISHNSYSTMAAHPITMAPYSFTKFSFDHNGVSKFGNHLYIFCLALFIIMRINIIRPFIFFFDFITWIVARNIWFLANVNVFTHTI